MRPILAAVLCLCAHAVPAQEVFFQAPSGNIHCAIFDGTDPVARCDIRDFTASFARPDDCELDWGFAFVVGTSGQGYPLCAGDTVAVPGAQVLRYGQSIALAGITCMSAAAGMTCVNVDGGGFTLARARQRVF